MKCPTCGHDPDQTSKAAKSRWSAMTKEQRSKEMSRIRKKGIKAKKKKKRLTQTDAPSSSTSPAAPANQMENQ